MSVAESMVILAPISQVGWRSACSGVTAASSARGVVRNGPPEAVMHHATHVGLSSPAKRLENRVVLAVDRQQSRAARGRTAAYQLAGDDHDLFVGERDVTPAVDGRERGRETDGTDETREHHIGARRCRHRR